jgi:hypothetical protein
MDAALQFIEPDATESPSGVACEECGGEIVLLSSPAGELYASCACGMLAAIA